MPATEQSTQDVIDANRKQYEDGYRALTGSEVDLENSHLIRDFANWLEKERPGMDTFVFDWPQDKFDAIMREYEADLAARELTASLFTVAQMEPSK